MIHPVSADVFIYPPLLMIASSFLITRRSVFQDVASEQALPQLQFLVEYAASFRRNH